MKLIRTVRKGKYTLCEYEVPSMHGPWYPSTRVKRLFWDGNVIFINCYGNFGGANIVTQLTEEDYGKIHSMS